MSIKRACKAANVLDDRLDTQLAWSGEPAVGQPDVHYFPVFPPAGAPAGVLVTSGRSSGILRPERGSTPAGQVVSYGRSWTNCSQLRPFHSCPGRTGCRHQSSGRSIGFAPAVGEAYYGHSRAHSGRSYGSLRP